MEIESLIGKNIFEWGLLSAFAISFLIQLFFLIGFYFRLLFLKKAEPAILENALTVLFCVRNEEDRISKVLGQVLQQNHGSFDIVVVDDFSEDHTLQILGTLSQKYPQLRFTTIGQETRFSEKLSINLGLKASHSEWVVIFPVSADEIDPGALSALNDLMADDLDAVISYSNYSITPGFMCKLCRLDRFIGFLRSASYSLAGFPLVFDEKNVAFKKQLYFKSQGFRGKLNQHFANLELVLNQEFKRVKIAVLPETSILENELVDKQSLINLIKKELVVRRSLGIVKRLLLLFEDLSKLIFLFSFIMLLIFKQQAWGYFTILFLVPNITFLFIVKKISDRLKEEKNFISSFMYILIKPLINSYHAALMYIQERRSKWN